MSNTSDNSEIDDIINELKEGAAPSVPKSTSPVEVPKITDENVGDYVYQKSAEMIELTLNAIKDMQQLIQTAADPKEIAAYAQLMSTAFKGIDSLNKINIQQKQAKNNIEVKKIEAEGKGKTPLLAGTGQQTNNIFIGSRDDAMKLLNGEPSRPTKKIKLEDAELLEDE